MYTNMLDTHKYKSFNNHILHEYKKPSDACFECLPPYAAMLSMNERNTYSRFLNTIRQGYVPLEDSTVENDVVVKWVSRYQYITYLLLQKLPM